MKRDPSKLDAWRRRSKPLTTRAQIQRRTELRRSRTTLPRRNPERAARRFAVQFGSAERVEWLHGFPCCACGHRGEIHAHHVVSRGAGGTADDMVPLCATCHARVHTIGRTRFEAERGVDLGAEARRFAAMWEEYARRIVDALNREAL